jgi:putative Ca2+/H+ antiporter (TMEM165/GDT1 family)
MRKEGADVDWRTVLATFSTIFLAEMGDKTQLATVTLAASTQQPLAVFCGAALALVAVCAVGVAIGGALGAYLPLVWIRRAAALAFIGIGLLMLGDKL